MSKSNKNKNKKHNEQDGLAKLMDAFGGYDEKLTEDGANVLPEDAEDLYTEEDITVVLDGEDVPDETQLEEETPVTEEPASDETAQKPEKKSKNKNKAKKQDDVKKSEKASGKKAEKSDNKKDKKKTDKKSEKKSDNKKAKKNDKKSNKHTKKKDDKSDSDKQKPITPTTIVVTLAVICAAVALLLGAVNYFTKSQIEENTRAAMLDSIREIFNESVQAKEITPPEGSDITAAYLVMNDEGVCGYSAVVAPSGFGGPISLMVGVDSYGRVVGVDVVSMSETPGLGSKVSGQDFLSQFEGASGTVSVDVISGASISSKAVISGVNGVTENLLDIEMLAKENGMKVVAFDPNFVPATIGDETSESEPVGTETETEMTSTSETTKETTEITIEPVTSEGETTVPPETSGLPVAPPVSKTDTPLPPDVIVPNPNPGIENPGIDVDFSEDTTEFETITTISTDTETLESDLTEETELTEEISE